MTRHYLSYRRLMVVTAAGLLAAGLSACGSGSPSRRRFLQLGRIRHPGHGELAGEHDHPGLQPVRSPPPRRRAWALPDSSTSRCSSSTSPSHAKYTNWLATGYTWGTGGKSVTFTIRQGVKWNNGTPLTPADVVFTYNLVKANTAINLAGLQISSVSSSGNTVTLTFPSAQYTNLQQIAGRAHPAQVDLGQGQAARPRSRTRTPSARARTS